MRRLTLYWRFSDTDWLHSESGFDEIIQLGFTDFVHFKLILNGARIIKMTPWFLRNPGEMGSGPS
jgi:hypothetical protein